MEKATYLQSNMADKYQFKKCSYVFRGNFVHSTSENALEILPDKILGISPSGKILFIENGESNQNLLEMQYGFTSKDVIFLKPRQFIMPGLIDTHIHAPQYSFTGTGYDCHVVDWLNKYTFPTEARFEDTNLALDVYKKLVRRLLMNGTTTASYFATIHLNATMVLCDVIVELGQRAYVGISDVDCSPHEHSKTTECCAEETERFIKHVIDMNHPLVTPVLTARGVAHCTKSLLTIHGELAKKYNVPIQGHLREIKDELASWNFASEFSQTSDLAKILEECELLTDKAYYAHCIYVTEEEIDLMLLRSTGVAHCPISNFDLKSGVADIRHLLDRQLKVGLGTDVSGGHSPSMLDVIRQCITASNVVAFSKPESYRSLSYKDAFRLATLGGSEVLGLSDKIGNFEVSKEFDALLIDPDAEDSPFDCFDNDTLEDVIQKFLMLGDDRNILQVYVAGRPVAGRTLVSSYFSSKRKQGLDIEFTS